MMPRNAGSAPPVARRERPSALGLLPWLGALWLGVAVARLPLLTPDVWWHLATGRVIAATGIPRGDPFSYTLAGRTWIVHEWLADLALRAAEMAGGLLGIVYLRAALLVLAALLAYRLARQHAGRLVAVGCVALAAWASQRNWLDRPQLWSYALAPLVLLGLERLRGGGRRLEVLLPVAFVVWVNLHGGFMLGLVSVWLWALAEAWSVRRNGPEERALARRFLWIALACSLATLANPHALQGALYPLRYVGAGLRETIQEERPGALDSASAWVHLLLALALVGIWLVRWRQVPLAHRAVGLALAWLSMPRLGGIALPLAAERHAPLFLFAGVPLLAWQIGALLGRRAAVVEERLATALGTPAAWSAALVLAGFAAWQAGRALPRDPSPAACILPGRFPEAGARWLAAHRLPGNLVNPYRWGGYLTHALWPRYSVWIDSRGDLYGAERLREDELLYRMPRGAEPRAEALLARYDANVVVWYFLTVDFGPLQLHPFTRWLLQRPDWRLVFVDRPDPARPRAPSGTTAIFLRVHPRNAALLEQLLPVSLPPGTPR